jgi:hypothetical protein
MVAMSKLQDGSRMTAMMALKPLSMQRLPVRQQRSIHQDHFLSCLLGSDRG